MSGFQGGGGHALALSLSLSPVVLKKTLCVPEEYQRRSLRNESNKAEESVAAERN